MSGRRRRKYVCDAPICRRLALRRVRSELIEDLAIILISLIPLLSNYKITPICGSVFISV
mgnify:CR=1 FL=1